FSSSGSSAAGASTWPPHSPIRRTLAYCLRLFSCGGLDMAPALPHSADTRLLPQALRLRGPRHGPRTPPFGGHSLTASGSSAAGASTWPPHSPIRRTLAYCLRLFSCGGLDMAPALPHSADTRLLPQALRLRGPRHGPRTPPFGGHSLTASGSSAAGASTWPPHSPIRRTLAYCLRLFSCGGLDMAPALPHSADTRLLPQALRLRGPRHGPRTPPFGGHSLTASGSSAAGASTWPPHSPHSADPRLLPQALRLRGPRHRTRTPPLGGHPVTLAFLALEQ